jgi:predicted glutamine amidotransferase
MCGNFGVIINKAEDLKTDTKLRFFFEQCLVVGELRGGDGTGMMAITKKDYTAYKKAVSGPEFGKDPEVINLLLSKDLQALLGHHRKGTVGSASDDNTHPFEYGNTYLFHNGSLDRPYRFKNKYGVDSESIADDIDQCDGDSDKIVKVLEAIEGAYSLVWYDVNTDTINFARNKDRPMFFGITPAGSVLYASEAGMLSWLACRNGITLKEIKTTEAGDWVALPSDLNPTYITSTKFKPFERVIDEYDWEGYYQVYPSRSVDKSKVIYIGNTSVANTTKGVVGTGMDKLYKRYPSLTVKKPEEILYCDICSDTSGKFHTIDDGVLCEQCYRGYIYS